MAIAASPPRRSTSPAVSSSSSVMQSHSRLPEPWGTSSARWPMANRGSMPIPVRPASSRTALWCEPRSSSRVVHCWPSTGTYWRASSHTGQAPAGPPNCTPQVAHTGSIRPRSCHGGGVNPPFLVADGAIISAQAALVALPGAGIPAWLERIKGRGWALILPLSVAVVVAAIELVPAVADGLTWVALVLVPPGAALALGWAMHGARPWYALFALALLILAVADLHGLAGDAAAAALTALSAVTVGRLLAGGVPLGSLKAGVVAMAVVDSILVFGNELEGPNAVLNAAIPLPGLPQLQYLDLHYASLGYGDVFVAGVLGGVLAAEGTRQLPIALLTLVFSAAWDLLFFHFHTLPATVPPAAALLVSECIRRRPGT